MLLVEKWHFSTTCKQDRCEHLYVQHWRAWKLMFSHEEWGNKSSTNNYNLQNILPGQYYTVICKLFLSVCLFIYTQCVALVRNTWPSEPPQKPTQSFSVCFPFTAINSVNGFLMFFRPVGSDSDVCCWFHDYLTDWYQCKKKCPVLNLFYV